MISVATSVGVAVAEPVTANAASALIADFTFESTGGLAGAGATATASGGPTYTTGAHLGVSSRYVTLDGTDDWFNVTKTGGGSLLAGLDVITVSYESLARSAADTGEWAVFAAQSTAAQAFGSEKYFGLMDTTDAFYVERYYNTGTRYVGANITSAAAYTAWKKVDIVITEASTTLYIGGVKIASQSSTDALSKILGSAPVLQIGKGNWNADSEFGNVSIDNFKIWSGVNADIVAAGFTIDSTQYNGAVLPTTELTLPVTWTCSDTSALAGGRIVSGESDKTVTLTATIDGATKAFTNITIKAASAEQPFYAYIPSVSGATSEGNDYYHNYSMHLATSVNDTVTPLNWGDGVLFAAGVTGDGGFTSNRQTMLNPFVFKMAGGYGVVAQRASTAGASDLTGGILFWTTDDLIHYSAQSTLTFGTGTLNQPQAVYNSSDGYYYVSYLNGNNAVWYRTQNAALTGLASYTGTLPSGVSRQTNTQTISGATASCTFTLPYDKAKYVVDKLTPVTNTGADPVDTSPITIPVGGTLPSLPASVRAYYSDGGITGYPQGQDDVPIKWDTSAVDVNAPGTYTITGAAQVKDYPFPWIEAKADPDIRYYNGYYYFIATYDKANTNGITSNYQECLAIRRATTIEGLATATDNVLIGDGDSWDNAMDDATHSWDTRAINNDLGFDDSSNLKWAPELHVINGKLSILFAYGSEWNLVQCHIMTLKDGGNPLQQSGWNQPVRILKNGGGALLSSGNAANQQQGISLDMSIFNYTDSSGKERYYYIWSSRSNASHPGTSVGGHADLCIGEFDPAQPDRLINDTVNHLVVPLYGWEVGFDGGSAVDEGPYMIEHGGRKFVSFSAAFINNSYVVGLLEYTGGPNGDPMNQSSWLKANYPSVTTNHVTGQFGPGHNAYTTDEYGRDVFVYHARQPQYATGTDSQRDASIRTVHWDAYGDPILDMSAERMLLPQYRDYSITVTVEGDDAAIAAAAANVLGFKDGDILIENVTLPDSVKVGDSTVTLSGWTSSDDAVLDDSDHAINNSTYTAFRNVSSAASANTMLKGVITRPAAGSADAPVTLTCTAAYNGAQTELTFNLTVKARETFDFGGYFYTYFNKAYWTSPTEKEAIFAAYSANGFDFTELNIVNGHQEPILTSTMGSTGLRDPFIFKVPGGGKYYQVATDLFANGTGTYYDSKGAIGTLAGQAWGSYVNNASKFIMVWESSDLIHWSDQRMVQIVPDNFGMAWAPEINYDPVLGDYICYFSSRNHSSQGANDDGNDDVYFVRTRDFKTFTTPTLWISGAGTDTSATRTSAGATSGDTLKYGATGTGVMTHGNGVIDSTMAQAQDGNWYRATKNESGNGQNNNSTQSGMRIFLESAPNALGPWTRILTSNLWGATYGIEGPEIYRIPGSDNIYGNDDDDWIISVDEYANNDNNRGLIPYVTTTLTNGASDFALPSASHSKYKSYDYAAGAAHGALIAVSQTEIAAIAAASWDGEDEASLLTPVTPVVKAVETGSAPSLPTSVLMTTSAGNNVTASVSWGSAAYTVYDTVTVNGTASANGYVSAPITAKVEVIPADLKYFVNAGTYGGYYSYQDQGTPANEVNQTKTEGSDVFAAVKAQVTGLKNDQPDGKYSSSGSWGWIERSAADHPSPTMVSGTLSNSSDKKYSAMIADLNTENYFDYQFDNLEPGIYTVAFGTGRKWNDIAVTATAIPSTGGVSSSVTAPTVTASSTTARATLSVTLDGAANSSIIVRFSNSAGAVVVSWVEISRTGDAPNQPSLAISPASWTYAALPEGYSAQSAADIARQFTVTNSGGGEAAGLSAEAGGDFEISAALSSASIAANGGTATVSVKPKAGLALGPHTGAITVGGVSVALSVEVVDAISVSPQSLDWGALTLGYSAPSAKTVTVVNNTSAQITASVAASPAGNVVISPESLSIAGGAAAEFTVTPATGQAVGGYSAAITVTPTPGAAKTLTAGYSVATLSDLPKDYYADTVFDKFTLVGGETLTATTYFSNNYPTAGNFSGYAFLAFFGGDGRLIRLTRQEFTAAQAATKNDITIAGEVPEAASKAVSYVWDTRYAPVATSTIFTEGAPTELPDPVLWYEFNTSTIPASGATASIPATIGPAGTLTNGAQTNNPSYVTQDGYTALRIDSASRSRSDGDGDWFSAPISAIGGKDSITISLHTRVNWTGVSAAQDRFTFAIQQETSAAWNAATPPQNYLALATIGVNRGVMKVNGGAEAETNARSNLSNGGVWEHWVIVVTPELVTFYKNGAKYGSFAAPGKLSDMGATAFEFGRSCYDGDVYACADYDDFRVYNGAFDENMIALLGSEVAGTDYTDTRDSALLGDWAGLAPTISGAAQNSGASVSASFDTLPAAGVSGSAIAWETTNSLVVSNTGVVNRPEGANAVVDLVATLTNNGAKLTKVFKYIVAGTSYQAEVEAVINSLALDGDASNFAYDAVLPYDNDLGAAITWMSSDTTAMASNGENRVTDSTPREVVLTATVTKGTATMQKTFTLTVKKPVMYGYTFAYFIGNKSLANESIYFGTSADGYQWTEMNAARVVSPASGSTHVRDPFIIKGVDPNGKLKYYMIATDLHAEESAYHDDNGIPWESGYCNTALYTWESDDMVNWSAETRLVLAGPSCQYPYLQDSDVAWAPEAMWDPNYQGDGFTGAYLMYWTANVSYTNASGGTHAGDSNHLVYAYTRDFKTFLTEPTYLYSYQVTRDQAVAYTPAGTNTTGNWTGQTMDGHMIYVNNKYYLFFRVNAAGIRRVEAAAITGQQSDWSGYAEIVGRDSAGVAWEGPETFQLIGSTGASGWIFLADKYTSNGTTNGSTTSRFGAFAVTDITGARANATNNNGTGNFGEIASGTAAGQTNINIFMSGDRARHGAVVQVDEPTFRALHKKYLGTANPLEGAITGTVAQ
jgi:GH43 family beta-xylosidase